MMHRLVLLLGLAIAGVARADYLRLQTEIDPLALDGVTTLASLGMPADIAVLNVYAAFSDPADRLVQVQGMPTSVFHVSTTAPGGFVNAGPAVGGSDRPPSQLFAGAFPVLNWDSFYTIGNRLLDVGPSWSNGAAFTDVVQTTPNGVPSPNTNPWTFDNHAWFVSPTQAPPGGGPPEPPPQSIAGNWSGNRVLIMRLAVDTDGLESIVEGTMTLITFDNTGATLREGETFFAIVPEPGAIAILAVAGLGRRRRRR